MTTTSEMVFEVKCLKCGTIYRSELAHVGRSIQCGCGSLVKIIPPLKSLTDVAGTPTRSTPTRLSSRKIILWLAVAVAVAVALVVSFAKFTSETPSKAKR
jgi:DNA-directed RNA polymerase subunit RPC12/RpoP